jgi:hypothetical protein
MNNYPAFHADYPGMQKVWILLPSKPHMAEKYSFFLPIRLPIERL